MISAASLGIDGFLVKVEVHVGNGLPAYNVVGLPDAAVRESRERVTAALQSLGFEFPARRLTVNLAPAGVRKEGPAFDVPIALGILLASEQLPRPAQRPFGVVGELALDGAVRPVRGALCLAVAVREAGIDRFVVPAPNAPEAALASGLTVHGVASLRELVSLAGHIGGAAEPAGAQPGSAGLEAFEGGVDLSDVRGQARAKRAAEIAAAGGHHLLMIGPPGAGKTMLARRLPTVLPPLGDQEAIDATKIASVAGLLAGGVLLRRRPFRAPHHTISLAGMAGGGQPVRPGEISLAHHGVLFLDELPEFRRATLEVLRQPLEEGHVVIARAAGVVRFPARFQLVAAMNPCPCGWRGDSERECRCSGFDVQRYLARVSGPLLDRIDLQVEVGRLGADELLDAGGAGGGGGRVYDGRVTHDGGGARDSGVASAGGGMRGGGGMRDGGRVSAAMRHRVLAARRRAALRLRRAGLASNAELDARQVQRFCPLPAAGKRLLRDAIRRHGFSARACHRVMKVARTIADLTGRDAITESDVAEAIMYRVLDRREAASGGATAPAEPPAGGGRRQARRR